MFYFTYLFELCKWFFKAFFLHCVVPKVRTDLGKKAFVFSVPTAWNNLQADLKPQTVQFQS